MFILRVHSVDLERPISIEEEATGFTYALKRAQPPLKLIQPSASLKITVRKGLIHFYRNSSHSSLSNPRFRSTTLFIVDPNYFSTLDFIRFCDSRIANVSEILFIRQMVHSLFSSSAVGRLLEVSRSSMRTSMSNLAIAWREKSVIVKLRRIDLLVGGSAI